MGFAIRYDMTLGDWNYIKKFSRHYITTIKEREFMNKIKIYMYIYDFIIKFIYYYYVCFYANKNNCLFIYYIFCEFFPWEIESLSNGSLLQIEIKCNTQSKVPNPFSSSHLMSCIIAIEIILKIKMEWLFGSSSIMNHTVFQV